ncbi:TetR/AcrR family transcriptional regulator [Acinetobacter pittii]|uniref:TetR/AcrR family transcriptional regulator n=1 Tax=Acinetobacter pittii TaxID=48296 RepID=UPI003A8468BD
MNKFIKLKFMNHKFINMSQDGRSPLQEDETKPSRTLIIQTARELFTVEGYENVSMLKIAEKASCLPSNLYTLFPSKRILLHEVLELIYQDLKAYLEECYEKSHETERLESVCFAQIDFWLSQPGDWKIIFLSEDIYLNYRKEIVSKKSALFKLEIYNRVIIEAQLNGIIRSGSSEEIKNILLSTIMGTVLILINHHEYNIKNLKEKTIRSLINGLKYN